MPNYTDQKKKEILEAIRTQPKSQISKKYKVSLQTIRNWEKVNRSPARESYSDLPDQSKRIRELEDLVMRLIRKLDTNGLL